MPWSTVTWKELSQSVMQQKIEEEDLLDNIQVFDLVLCIFLHFDCLYKVVCIKFLELIINEHLMARANNHL